VFLQDELALASSYAGPVLDVEVVWQHRLVGSGVEQRACPQRVDNTEAVVDVGVC